MEQRPLKKNYKLLNIARILRRNLTRQEKHLWYDFLRYYPVKIYKQRNYTKLGKAHDEARTEILERYGIYVLRFSNKDIDENFEGVCRMIDRIINERIENVP